MRMASGTANGTAHEELSFLPRLTQSFGSIQQSPTIETEGFCQAMALILPVFDQLGKITPIATHGCLLATMGCGCLPAFTYFGWRSYMHY